LSSSGPRPFRRHCIVTQVIAMAPKMVFDVVVGETYVLEEVAAVTQIKW
jgi:hypothetical protein